MILPEEGQVVSGGVVIGGDFEKRGEGVEFVLAFEDGGVAVCGGYLVVGGCSIDGCWETRFGGWLEGVAIG